MCCVYTEDIVTEFHCKTNQIIFLLASIYIMHVPTKLMTPLSNLKGFSSQAYFFHSTGHYNECVTACTCNSVPPDPTMTVDNVSQILNNIPKDKWEEVMGIDGLDIPGPLVEEIQRRYSTNKEKNHACADYYVNYHPDAEWAHLTMGLYITIDEQALARESKSFISTGKNT